MSKIDSGLADVSLFPKNSALYNLRREIEGMALHVNNRASPDTLQKVEEYATIVRSRLGNRVKRITLFGSQARGEAWEGSDFDVVVVVDHRNLAVEDAISDAAVEMMDRHQTLFAALVYDEQEWDKARRFPLGWNIEQEGLAL